ncbi:MAG: C1 family peptidase [Sandaracinaceae bacterium]|nr:C1 family peptidase [Sandaracinaceae bacterium]
MRRSSILLATTLLTALASCTPVATTDDASAHFDASVVDARAEDTSPTEPDGGEPDGGEPDAAIAPPDAVSAIAGTITSPRTIEGLDYGAVGTAVLTPSDVLNVVVVGRAIELVGSAEGGAPPYTMTWRSSLDGPLGTGPRATVMPTEGEHDVVLEVMDATGAIGSSAPLPLHVLPATFDWSHVRRPAAPPAAGDWMTPVRSQGRCGSCWAMAALAVMEGQMNIDRGDPSFDVDLSEQTTIDCDMHSIGCAGGGSEQSLSGYLHDVGAVAESCNPFLGTDDMCIEGCRDGSTPARYRVEDTRAVVGDGGANDAIRAWMRYQLVHHGPIARTIINMLGYDGTTHLCAPLGGDHYVAVVGYDDVAGLWIAKNSWGARWNGDGYMEVSYGNCAIDASATIVTHVIEP